MSQRVVIPELLDHLPSDDPESLRSRQDLRQINFLMGNERWVLRTVRGFSSIAEKGIVEIGAGDGKLCEKLASLFPKAPVAAYDFAPRPDTLDARVDWRRGDIFDRDAPEHGGVLLANLFLHHFEGDALLSLGRWMRHFDLLVFNEPDRSRLPHVLGGMMHPFINRVTRHDMHVSIRAGFQAGEIGRLLGLDRGPWQMRETSTWRGARHVVAWR